MNCPWPRAGVQSGPEELRGCHLRLAEFGSCHRNEAIGFALHRSDARTWLTQDGRHIFCTDEVSVKSEGSRLLKLTAVLRDFRLDDVELKLSTRPDDRMGD